MNLVLVKVYSPQYTSTMETIIVNLAKEIRSVHVNGQEYLIAPVTMIVPGVLDGSQGPIYYSPEEIAVNHLNWNGVPIVIKHPAVKGEDGKPQYVSARQPGVMATTEVGRVYNTHINNVGALQAEAWFDVASLKRVDRRVYDLLQQGNPVEVSVGLFSDVVPASDGAMYVNGKGQSIKYTHTARNFRPDHLAVLPDQKGACKIEDGCGLLMVNAAHPESQSSSITSSVNNNHECKCKGNTMAFDKNATITWLVTNCDDWKEDKDKDILNSMSDAKLQKLKDKAEREQKVELLTNAARESYKKAHGLDAPNDDALSEYLKTATKPTEQKKETPTVNSTPSNTTNQTPSSPQESRLTPEELEDLSFARQWKLQAKTNMINKLVANVAATAQPRLKAIYEKMPIDELQELAKNVPEATAPTPQIDPMFLPIVNDFSGQAGIPVNRNSSVQPAVDRSNVLLPNIPINWGADDK
jgi:spore coat protein CotF